jgi:hypothetical protein
MIRKSACASALTAFPTPVKFAQLIRRLHKKTGEGVVILVDEYDKPLIDNLSKEEVYPKVKEALHSFNQVIKANDKHLRFVFLIEVSQFSGLSIFSGLNNLDDITMSEENSDICGYTFRRYMEVRRAFIGNLLEVCTDKET